MKIKINKLLPLLLAIFLVTYDAIVYHRDKATDNFSCTSDTSIYHDNFHLDALFNVTMAKGSGSIRVNGQIVFNNRQYTISRQVHFNYQKTDSEYTLKSTQITVFSDDNSINGNAASHLPLIFFEEGKKLGMDIKQDDKGNRIMSTGIVPVLYCQS